MDVNSDSQCFTQANVLKQLYSQYSPFIDHTFTHSAPVLHQDIYIYNNIYISQDSPFTPKIIGFYHEHIANCYPPVIRYAIGNPA